MGKADAESSSVMKMLQGLSSLIEGLSLAVQQEHQFRNDPYISSIFKDIIADMTLLVTVLERLRRDIKELENAGGKV